MNRFVMLGVAFFALLAASSAALASVPKRVFGEEFGASW